MNPRHEASLWSITILLSIALGLSVIWAGITLAFNQPNLGTLYYAAAPYRQDDYSAEAVNSVRLNPLDPAIVQEVNFEDQGRASLLPAGNQQGLSVPTGQPIAPPVSTASKRSTPTNPPQPALAEISTLTSTSTSLPAPTSTSRPAPTSTSQPAPTNTSQPAPTSTSQPAPTSTSQPAPTSTSRPAPTSTSQPAPTSTSQPAPTSTSQPAPTSTSQPHSTHTPWPSHTPHPTYTP